MTDSNKLIQNITFDIISIVTIWGLVNSSYMPYNFNIDVNNKYFKFSNNINIKNTLITIGMGTSIIILRKYY